MFGGVTDRNCVDKQLNVPLFAVRRSFQWTNHLGPWSKTLTILSHLHWWIGHDWSLSKADKIMKRCLDNGDAIENVAEN